ncbi:putative N-acetylmannosamine-6-phosphate 2-epimerase [compost metagenome]
MIPGSPMPADAILDRIRGGLVVSCQAGDDEPLHGCMAGMARAALHAGAVGIRAEGPRDIRAIRDAVDLPILGLYKIRKEGVPVYITPTFESACMVVHAGADVVAIDATTAIRPDGLTLEETITRIHRELNRPVLADVSTLDEGLRAAQAGADAVAPTLSGYTPQSPRLDGPDWELLQALIRDVQVPVLMEGRIWQPDEARKALDLGSWAVVVGSAITRPQLIAARFVQEIRRHA